MATTKKPEEHSRGKESKEGKAPTGQPTGGKRAAEPGKPGKPGKPGEERGGGKKPSHPD